MTGIEEENSSRRKRTVLSESSQTKSRIIIVEFVSVCYVWLSSIINIDTIKTSLMDSIKSFESESLIDVVQPEVIEIEKKGLVLQLYFDGSWFNHFESRIGCRGGVSRVQNHFFRIKTRKIFINFRILSLLHKISENFTAHRKFQLKSK